MSQEKRNTLMKAIEIEHHLGGAIQIIFGSAIEPDGEIIYVTISKFDQRITLSRQQAKSMAQQIMTRIRTL